MALEMSGVTAWIMNMLVTPLMWLILIVVFVVGALVILYIRKRRRLMYKCVEVVDLGNGKHNLNNMKAGYFGKKSILRGLIWWGDDTLKTDTGEEIIEFSTEDYQEVDGERGIVCYRDPLNQKYLTPINKLEMRNKHLIAEIPPASYVDAATRIVEEAGKETSDRMEKVLQFVAWALVIVFSLVAIIVIIQYVKSGQDKAANLILEAGKTCLENARQVCSDITNTARSTTAP